MGGSLDPLLEIGVELGWFLQVKPVPGVIRCYGQ